MREKNEVLPRNAAEVLIPQRAENKNKRSLSLQILGTALGAWLLFHLCTLPSYYPLHGKHHHHDSPSKACEQADPVLPQSFNVSALVPGNEVRIREWLMGAVKVPTEVFDVMGEIGEDPRWDVFYDFSACKWLDVFTARNGADCRLGESLPSCVGVAVTPSGRADKSHQHLTRNRVVTHALVFEWAGSDSSLKPLLLTGHQGKLL